MYQAPMVRLWLIKGGVTSFPGSSPTLSHTVEKEQGESLECLICAMCVVMLFLHSCHLCEFDCAGSTVPLLTVTALHTAQYDSKEFWKATMSSCKC